MDCFKNNKSCIYCKRKLNNFKDKDDKINRKNHFLHKTCYKQINEQIESNLSIIDHLKEGVLNASTEMTIEFIEKNNKKLCRLLKRCSDLNMFDNIENKIDVIEDEINNL